MEILAALIGARLCKLVIEALGWEDMKIYFWSDSRTVLAWITGLFSLETEYRKSGI